MKKHFFAAIFIIGTIHLLSAQAPPPELFKDSSLIAFLKEARWLDSLEKSLQFREGKVNLKNGLATINVPAGYKYLNPEQSEIVLNRVWSNPPDKPTLGLLFRDTTDLLASSPWVVEITYEEGGYVNDDNASSIDYNALLTQMKKDAEAENAKRVKLGYEPVSIEGWAVAPTYDEKNNRLVWGQEMKFGNEKVNSLNYHICILGRKGVLMLNIITEMDKLPALKKDIDRVLASISFNKGNSYAEFDSSNDIEAAYGMEALVTGKGLGKADSANVWMMLGLGIVGIAVVFRGQIAGLFGKK